MESKKVQGKHHQHNYPLTQRQQCLSKQLNFRLEHAPPLVMFVIVVLLLQFMQFVDLILVQSLRQHNIIQHHCLIFNMLLKIIQPLQVLNLFCLSSLIMVFVQLQLTKYHHQIQILLIQEVIFCQIQQTLVQIVPLSKQFLKI